MIRQRVRHVVNLSATSPAAGLLPYENAGTVLSELALGRMTSLAPFKGQESAVADALGVELPAIGRSNMAKVQEITWFSQGQSLVIGSAQLSGLDGIAATTDQSDAWCCQSLSGALSDQVLARLVPVDVRAQIFGIGHVMRSQLGHMPMHLTRVSDDGFRLMSFRSMAETMVHEITRALDFLATRG